MYQGYALTVVTPPYAEPVDLAEAKLHLKVEVSDDDDLIRAQLAAAREQAEAFLNRALVVRTYDLFLDSFPMCGAWHQGFSAYSYGHIALPMPPLRAVTFVKYTDINGTVQTLDPSLYTVDLNSTPGRIYPAYGQYWPTTRCIPNAVQVRFVAGYLVPFTNAAATDVVTALGLGFAANDVLRLTNSGGSLPSPLKPETDYYVRDVSGSTFKLALSAGGTAIDLKDEGAGTSYLGVLNEAVRAAIKLILAELYEHRSEAVEGHILQDVRRTADLLMMPHRIVPV